MPPKAKKKRASLKLTESGEVQDSPEESRSETTAPVRQVVEVVGDTDVPEAIDTIKRDTEEIEEAVATIEDELDHNAPEKSAQQQSVVPERIVPKEESVESLFVKGASAVTPEITVVGKRGSSLGVWVGAMLGVAMAIGVSLVFLVRNPSPIPFMQPEPTATPVPTTEPTQAPASTLDRKDIKLSVINGGGTPGAGSKMKSFLEEKGYTVISVGNAQEYTYEQTEILVKAGKTEYIGLLTEDLSGSYDVSGETGSVDADAAYDIRVIVGKK